MTDKRIPLFLSIGFLASGKTTLLNALLRRYPDFALLINELGDTGIDNQLIEGRSVPVTLLAGSCICCTARGMLDWVSSRKRWSKYR